LTQEAFDALLACLDNNRNQAARRYEMIRSKLIRLFAWRGSLTPEDLADETLDRVARKLMEGVEIESSDPYRYVSGVAYRVFHEAVREHKLLQKRKDEYQIESQRQLSATQLDGEMETLHLDCLKRCLAQLSEDERSLILRYHQGEKGVRIRNRKALAKELKLAINALRIRAHRIRHRLEKCTRGCVSGAREVEDA
jgi:DNA-directed RNA polymerase specialized sigma24 family protein